MAETPQPVNMRTVLFSALCEQAEKSALKPGEPAPKEQYPVYQFSGRELYEDKNGVIKT